uniref:Uncharacterized protein n=1 Tax=Arundo donax TaxID=35708 RepID=A0A0A9E034_ARUDO
MQWKVKDLAAQQLAGETTSRDLWSLSMQTGPLVQLCAPCIKRRIIHVLLDQVLFGETNCSLA